MKHTDSKSSLNILIIARYDPSIDWVQSSLQEQRYRVVGLVHSVEQAWQKLQEARADIILADSSGEGVLETAWIRTLALQAGGAVVLVTGSGSEMDFIREAMLAGAQGFLLKPFDLAELYRSIEQVHQLWLQRHALMTEAAGGASAASEHKARTIAVFSPKGGTGVTTLAVNVAVGLKQLSARPVLLVDADVRTADVDIFMNIFGKHSILDLIHIDQKVDAELLKSVATQHSSEVVVLRGDSRLQLIEDPIEPGHMSQLIEELTAIWDGYIVMNTSNGLDRWTVEILDAADTVLLTTTPELPALRVMRGFLDLAEAEADTSDKWQLVMTSYQSQKVLRMADIEGSIHYPIKATIAADFELVPASINRGTPFVLSHPKADISKNVMALARQLATPGTEPRKAAAGGNQSNVEQKLPEQSVPAGRRGAFWGLFSSSLRPSEKLERSAS